MFRPAFRCAQHPKAGRNTQQLSLLITSRSLYIIFVLFAVLTQEYWVIEGLPLISDICNPKSINAVSCRRPPTRQRVCWNLFFGQEISRMISHIHPDQIPWKSKKKKYWHLLLKFFWCSSYKNLIIKKLEFSPKK